MTVVSRSWFCWVGSWCSKSMIRSMLRKNPDHRPTVSPFTVLNAQAIPWIERNLADYDQSVAYMCVHGSNHPPLLLFASEYFCLRAGCRAHKTSTHAALCETVSVTSPCSLPTPWNACQNESHTIGENGEKQCGYQHRHREHHNEC